MNPASNKSGGLSSAQGRNKEVEVDGHNIHNEKG